MTKLNEAKLGRVWMTVTENEGSFVVLSAFRHDKLPEDNAARHWKLKTFFVGKEYGLLELRAGYTETNSDTQEVVMTSGDSLLLRASSRNSQKLKKSALMIAQELEQESIIFKDDTGFFLIGTNNSTGIGKVLDSFTKADNNDTNLNAFSLFEKYFSTLKKDSSKGRNLVFNIQEKQTVDCVNRAILHRAGKFTPYWEDVAF